MRSWLQLFEESDNQLIINSKLMKLINTITERIRIETLLTVTSQQCVQ